MKTETPLFSIIIPTVGRPAHLRRCLEALRIQSVDMEAIVVDQGGESETRRVCDEFSAVLALRHEVVSTRGLSRARNHGIGLACGEMVGFPDDDAWYPPGLLRQVAACFQSDAGVAAISGSCLDPQGGRGVARLAASPAELSPRNLFGRMVEPAFFVRREALQGVRYAPALGVGAGTPWGADEGPDLLLKLMARGMRVRYEPSLVVHHPTPANLGPRRAFSYACGRGKILRRHSLPPAVVVEQWARPAAGLLWSVARLEASAAARYGARLAGLAVGYGSPRNWLWVED